MNFCVLCGGINDNAICLLQGLMVLNARIALVLMLKEAATHPAKLLQTFDVALVSRATSTFFLLDARAGGKILTCII
jgi:hypothetical protein